MKMDSEKKAITEEKYSSKLRTLIDEVCASKKVFQGCGPPMSCIQTTPDANGKSKRFVYIIFSNGGIRNEGDYQAGAETFEDAIKNSVPAFDAWLQPHRTLAWRERPLVDIDDDGLLRVYWRCVQLDDGARSIAVDWHF